ncbi:unnamed protein product [Lactuca saligna]|uniref:Uncharacterized protein n=1 Tax=Lactuca saligna TaxID=75948 RepID=A0AA35Z4H3_LACSI|nr:unnamed protein product [Lactuca saligna]
MVEKNFLESKSVKDGSKIVLRAAVREVIKSGYGKENANPNFIKSELKVMDNVIHNGFNSNQMRESIPVKSILPSFSSSIPEVVVSSSCVNGNDKVMNEGSNDGNKLNGDPDLVLKAKQGSNFLDLKCDNDPMIVEGNPKSKISPATTIVNEINRKTYARIVENSSSVVDLNIKFIPKTDGKPVGKVELPYADLILGGAPYHATLYGFSVGKKLAFPTMKYFTFKMW